MKVYAIVGSYRKGGNTDLIIEQALQGARTKGAETAIIFLDDLQIGSCQGCMECRKEGICKLEDDVVSIVKGIDQADAVIVGTPIYGHYMTGQLKILLDRLMGVISQTEYKNGQRNSVSRLSAKKRNILTVMTAGAPEPDCADDALKLTRRMLASFSNDGTMTEIIATGVNAQGQITWSIDELTQVARQQGSPTPEATAEKMKAANDSFLQEAFQKGIELTNL